MRIKILNSAKNDLIDGYWFYEKQMEGIGTYFLDSIFSDIDSLKYMREFTLYILKNIIAYYRNDFLLLFIIVWKMILLLYMQFLIVDEILHG